MVLHKKSPFFQSVDDTLGVFHTHAVAGVLGGLLSGIFAKPKLLRMMYRSSRYGPGLLYCILDGNLHNGLRQMWYQILGALFIIVWNVGATSLICYSISKIVDLRMKEEDLDIGDDAVHGEEAYALWGDGEKTPATIRRHLRIPSICRWQK